MKDYILKNGNPQKNIAILLTTILQRGKINITSYDCIQLYTSKIQRSGCSGKQTCEA